MNEGAPQRVHDLREGFNGLLWLIVPIVALMVGLFLALARRGPLRN